MTNGGRFEVVGGLWMTRNYDGIAAFYYHPECCEAPGVRLIVVSFVCDDREESSWYDRRWTT